MKRGRGGGGVEKWKEIWKGGERKKKEKRERDANFCRSPLNLANGPGTQPRIYPSNLPPLPSTIFPLAAR